MQSKLEYTKNPALYMIPLQKKISTVHSSQLFSFHSAPGSPFNFYYNIYMRAEWGKLSGNFAADGPTNKVYILTEHRSSKLF